MDYRGTRTLWFNTGTLCNITCANCYIESSPTNDRLVYLTLADVTPFLDELDAAGEHGIEIGFTGGEPFMAPDILDMMNAALSRGHSVLMLTNAMAPMMRPRIKQGLEHLRDAHGDKLTLRISLDHYSASLHDTERGQGAFNATMTGMDWLSSRGFNMAVAGRSVWSEDEQTARDGYNDLFKDRGLRINAADPKQLVIFPEMTDTADPPEITTACWGILDKDPADIMCASQRMVVKRKGATAATVAACTLLPYDQRFDLGPTLEGARKSVALNHAWCATFCVLGGGSCSA